MKKGATTTGDPPSRLIDARIRERDDWRGGTRTQIRDLIREAVDIPEADIVVRIQHGRDGRRADLRQQKGRCARPIPIYRTKAYDELPSVRSAGPATSPLSMAIRTGPAAESLLVGSLSMPRARQAAAISSAQEPMLASPLRGQQHGDGEDSECPQLQALIDVLADRHRQAVPMVTPTVAV